MHWLAPLVLLAAVDGSVVDGGVGAGVADDAVEAAVEVGGASFYAARFEGRRTASGEVYRAAKATCAHRTAPFGTVLEVKAVRSKKTATCVVNDRGPRRKSRVVDVSRSVAVRLGLVRRGVVKVEVRVKASPEDAAAVVDPVAPVVVEPVVPVDAKKQGAASAAP